MKNECLYKQYEEAAKENMRRQKEKEIKPLSQYSTSQLKAELRRRKGK